MFEERVLTKETPTANGNGEDPSITRVLGANPFVDLEITEILKVLQDFIRLIFVNPTVFVREEWYFLKDLLKILLGQEVIAPDPGDKRFAHEVWKENKFYHLLMQMYLSWRTAQHRIVEGSYSNTQDKERAHFVLSLFTEAVAPTNTLIGNPGALKNLIDSKGMSLIRGFFYLLDDWQNNGGMPKQVDETEFELGGNIACSPGAVVFRNPVFELIQYKPQSEMGYERPLLAIPPQINKFYLVDLSAGRSFVEFASQKQIPCFVISWRNPTAAQSDWNLETYVQACKDAVQVVCEITQSPDVNLMAACVGGYTAAALLGHFQAAQSKLIHSVTFLVTVLDTSTPTLMSLFATPETVHLGIQRSRRNGVVEGQDMARFFAWLRPNDLIWPYVVNNYLMGNAPPAFDILYWNTDTTRLPAEFHADLLTFFLENILAQKNTLKILGTSVDLSKNDCDTFIVAGMTDHITPWKACYETTRILGGEKQFILSGSGHIQSIVSPPSNPKAKFYINPDLTTDAETWLQNATLQQGSWWHHWYDWIHQRSGRLRATPKILGSEIYPAGSPAPGRYVHQR